MALEGVPNRTVEINQPEISPEVRAADKLPPGFLISMKANEIGPNDEALRALLQQWRVEAPLPPRFEEGVWRRVERARAHALDHPLRRWLEQVVVWVNRPAIATACAALLLVAGVAAGSWHARETTGRWDRQLAQRYVVSVNPYALVAVEP